MFHKKKNIEVEETIDVVEVKEVPKVPLQSKVKNYTKSVLAFVLLAVAIVFVFVLVFNKKGLPQVICMLDENNTLSVADTNKPKKQYDLTQNYGDKTLENDKDTFAKEIQFSKNGKRIYYPENRKSDMGFDLYVKEYKKSKAEGKLVAEDVLFYQVLKDERIVYVDQEYGLYVKEKEEFRKISSSANRFYVDKDNKQILWEEKENNSDQVQLCYEDLKFKKESQKLPEIMDEVLYVTDDLKNIYIKNNGDLYIIKEFGEKEKIASDYSEGYFVGDNCYYTVKERDKYALYYYDGKNSTILNESIDQVLASGEQFVFYSVQDNSMKLYLAKNEAVTRVDLDEALEQNKDYQTVVDEESEKIFFLDYENSETGSLYVIFYGEGKVGNVTKVNSDTKSIVGAVNSSVYYIKNCKYIGSNYVGDLYCDGILLAEEIAAHSAFIYDEGAFYMKDWSNKDTKGTVMRTKNEKEKKVAENISMFFIK